MVYLKLVSCSHRHFSRVFVSLISLNKHIRYPFLEDLDRFLKYLRIKAAVDNKCVLLMPDLNDSTSEVFRG